MTNDPDALLQQAAEALKNKQYPAAESLQRKGCELLREQRAEESRIANEIEKLADIHCAQSKFDLCANEYADVVRMREKFLPENDFSILRVLYRLAKSHFEGQQYDQRNLRCEGCCPWAKPIPILMRPSPFACMNSDSFSTTWGSIRRLNLFCSGRSRFAKLILQLRTIRQF